MRKTDSNLIPPLSVVRLAKVTKNTPAWGGERGRTFRIGYYRRQDGLDCVWLVNDDGIYEQTVDQAMIRSHFEVMERSTETDLSGRDRPEIRPKP